ncbi:hypothetical protein [Kineococcus sp. SYSU DK005]|uniref:hypothetical protein n=1 Tax=Kineococcus sp. SYSU DK005 TaxID=3383126 RepID=UPI003D7EE445
MIKLGVIDVTVVDPVAERTVIHPVPPARVLPARVLPGRRVFQHVLVLSAARRPAHHDPAHHDLPAPARHR